jgi:hypothetical protein
MGRILSIFAIVLVLTGCVNRSSNGSLGMITKSSLASASSILKSGRPYRELGPAEGQTCQTFTLFIFPTGKSDFVTAVDNALDPNGGDALISITSKTTMTGAWFAGGVVCTTVKGTAIKFE